MFSGGNNAELSAAGQAGLSNSGISSPYLNFNPALVTPTESDYLYLEGSTGSAGRGRFELMFNTIGGFTAAGGAFGGVNGLIAGYAATQSLQGSARRTQMINFVAKRGASWGQMCGVTALMYSSIATILSKVRGHDDELNTVGSGTLSGLLFKSTAGLKGCLRGGAIGFGLTTAYVMITSKDRVMTMLGR